MWVRIRVRLIKKSKSSLFLQADFSKEGYHADHELPTPEPKMPPAVRQFLFRNQTKYRRKTYDGKSRNRIAQKYSASSAPHAAQRYKLTARFGRCAGLRGTSPRNIKAAPRACSKAKHRRAINFCTSQRHARKRQRARASVLLIRTHPPPSPCTT